jgi:hypothetical protein
MKKYMKKFLFVNIKHNKFNCYVWGLERFCFV